MKDLSNGEVIIYVRNGVSNIEVIQQNETLWLSVEKIANLYI